MATDSISTDSTPYKDDYNILKMDLVQAIIRPMASLRLTVVLFAMAIFIIFVGTLAQVDKDMWEVIQDYFRSVVAWIDFQVFFPRSWFPGLADKVGGGFPFPGGALIGAGMVINLLAAHLIRFKVQARGPALLLGLAVISVGTLVTYMVISSGHNQDGLQGQPSFSWETLWFLVKASLATIAIVSALGVAIFHQQISKVQIIGLVTMAVSAGVAAVWLFSMTTFTPTPASLRILWQLIQGGLAGLILLAGCWLVFRRRAGIVLLHVGVGLMMFSEFFVSSWAIEGRMTIREGETVNYVRDIRKVELAVIDHSGENEDSVVVIPASRLQAGKVVQNDQLPFDVHVEKYFKNADLRRADENSENYADSGAGTDWIAEPKRESSGTDGGEVDLAAVYVELRNKDSNASVGKFMLSQLIASTDRVEEVDVDGKKYDVSLRFKRDYKPYAMALSDVRKDDYQGTDTPRNYSSDVRLVDADRKIDREFKIWMNNPLRYAGETFYQSGYNVDQTGSEVTDLQVVTNTGWMMPYVGCMLVTIGMLMHFSATLSRFVGQQLKLAAETRTAVSWTDWALPAVTVLVLVGYVGSKMRPPNDTKAGMKIHEFGKLPVLFQGRVKPLDTLARNTLRIVSDREDFYDIDGNKQPAIRWLLDVITNSPDAAKHPVFRIENPDVRETLGIPGRNSKLVTEPRKEHKYRYAESEFADRIDEFQKQLNEARALDVAELNFYQRKLIETERRVRAVRLVEAAFTPVPYQLPPAELRETNPEEFAKAVETWKRWVLATPQLNQKLLEMSPPLVVPVGGEDGWMPYASAWNNAYIASNLQQEMSPATLSWTSILAAYADGDTNAFNKAVAVYQQELEADPPAELAGAKVPFEFFFNYSKPFTYSMVLYVFAFLLVAAAWLFSHFGSFKVLNRTAFALIFATLVIHTFALVARVMISGRPPVTNLYSSAVFIGWAAVVLGLVLEWFFRVGIGNAIAAIAGFSTLRIAYHLAADGDTFTVLQAVLDTQFWLATHVVCVTLGYATTFVAGLLGIVFIGIQAFHFLMRKQPSTKLNKSLTSMIYGTLCFAIYFSFVGTVLGGLWADDSWGRFWGWDPKENGALIIVLWNALILHARWGGMVRQRGLALLAVIGNITTAWSWFGVNELGVGLHSYGFTEGILLALGCFVASQMVIVIIGLATMFGGNAEARVST